MIGNQNYPMNSEEKKISIYVHFLTEIFCHFLSQSVFLLVKRGKLQPFLKLGKYQTLNAVNQTKMLF